MNLVTILIVVLILALVLYGISLVPLDSRAKSLIYIVLVVLVIFWLVSQSGVAFGQSRSHNPLEDFLRGIETRQGNSNVNCNIQHRLDRRGDIRWIRIECNDRRYGR